jgi:hypothetical protein
VKKSDLVVGKEYAVGSGRVHELSAYKTFGYGSYAFPYFGVRRVRVVAIDVPVKVNRKQFSHQQDKWVEEKMIQVEWLDSGIESLDRSNKNQTYRALGAFVNSHDPRFLTGARNFIAEWGDYAADRKRRDAERDEFSVKRRSEEMLRDRVLGVLAEKGIEAKSGRGFSTIEIESAQMVELLGILFAQGAEEGSSGEVG